jgi:predicted alpha/beta hydrolase family esterase
MTNVVFIHGNDGFDDDRSLADSLGLPVIYPRMPDLYDWAPAIASAVSQAEPPHVIIGHSAGGYQLLCFLATAPDLPIASVHIIAAPFPGGDPDWTFDGFDLPSFPERMPYPVFLYASEDDEVVPFAHRDLWAAELPGSVTRTTVGGHQLNNDLTRLLEDINRLAAS